MKRLFSWPVVILIAPLAAAALLIVLYFVTMWAATDFNPDFLSIDSCLDAGGAWDYEARRCNR
jgi:hypothetical protein